MKIVNMHEAKTHLSKLVEKASQGEVFYIAKSGVPKVKVIALDAPSKKYPKRTGFLHHHYHIPDDFDELGQKEIQDLFGDNE